MITIQVPDDIGIEIQRQIEKWGAANVYIPDDRWIEIVEDEFKDLRWAVRTCLESDNHTIAKERAQLIAVLVRWSLSKQLSDQNVPPVETGSKKVT